MDRFLAMSVFAQVVEKGHLTHAAETLGISASAVSRHVAELEAHLHVRLLNRTTRRMSLTEAGQVFYARCVQLLADLEEAEVVVSAGSVVPSGTLKLTCSITWGIRVLAPAIAAFVERFPQIRFEIELSDRAVDIVDEGIDLAIRIGDIGAQSLIGRRIGTMRLVCCAAPAYVAAHGSPAHPQELSRHRCLTYAYSASGNTWRFRDAADVEHAVRVSGAVHANNGQMLATLAAAGMGIVMEPDFIVAPELASGALLPLLADYAPASAGIYVDYASRRQLSAKVRAFVDYMAARFTRDPTIALTSRE
ncbi:MAG: LysR family transcriptional regulator [Casimicrobiaceae bacterium]